MKSNYLKYLIMLAFMAQHGMALSQDAGQDEGEIVKARFAKQDAVFAKWKSSNEGTFTLYSPPTGDTKIIVYQGEAGETSQKNDEAFDRLGTVANTACPGLLSQPVDKRGLYDGGTMSLETDKNLCELSMTRSVQIYVKDGQPAFSTANSPMVLVLLLKPKTQCESNDPELKMSALAMRKLIQLTPPLKADGSLIIANSGAASNSPNGPWQASAGSTSPAPTSLKAAMDAIPRANRPIGMAMRKGEWDSYSRSIEYTNMVLFPGSVAIPADCKGWNPQAPAKNVTGCDITTYSLANGKVRFPGVDEAVDLTDFVGYAPGKPVSIKVGNAGSGSSGSSFEGLGGSVIQVSRGELLMTPAGDISSGSWVSNSIKSNYYYQGNTYAEYPGVTGKYYLDGFLIAVQDNQGQISIGFIGQKNEEDDEFIFMNGELFWYAK
jgi:hypothetical protein